ncbi:unnamed protein product [Ceutorhynchus assimilis]|uniref:Mitochondrial 3-ketoacyl-coa thiolase n=1 Tax=Ceutorhynchus assimilis TaxID=467358 RepID=A0A9N9QID3_9CUCU|nr:unnamed protein product [Ceutorhynchus assimilis]
MAASLVKGSFIVGAKRTVFGTYGGKLKNVSITELQTIAAKAALASANVKPENVDTVVVGIVGANSSADGIFTSRHVSLKCGIPIEKPALAVNRLCGSGFQSIINGVQDLQTGFAQISLTGGVENMSSYPHAVRGLRWGLPLGSSPVFEDSLWAGLTDTYCNLPMGLTAEKLGAQFKLTREEVDEYALRSQRLWKEAQDAGRFKEELVPVPVKVKRDMVDLMVDEHPKPQTTLETLRKLPTVFKKDGLVTAGTASGICDGAGAVVLASEQALKDHNLKPLARVVAYSVVGVEPSIMGIGPAPAIRAILKATGKSLNDIDLVEINEAFGAQTLSCAKDLGLDINKLNVDGGAIALGHPLAASGSRITAHLVHELRRRKAKFGIGSACIGGGQGIAILNTQSDGALVARHAALHTGIPITAPAYSVNRLCGSGFQSIVNGVQDVESGFAQISLTGGVENMSAYPHVVRGLRWGLPLGSSPVMEDSLWLGLTDTYCNLPMGMTAEKLGAQFNITRDEVDQFALRSQRLWKEAQDAGRFIEELVPVPVKVKREIVNLSVDEHPKPQTTIEGLNKLPTVFKKDGLVTAGSASGICDGAGAVIVASEQAVKDHNLKPLARVVAFSVVGVEPSIMGIGPAPAIRAILKATGKSLNDIDLVEINEAFGAQTLACAKDLGLDLNKLNVDGGAIALGHPLAASGSRITTHLVHELRRRKAKFGIGSACIGGGQGIAIMVEAL